MFNGITIVNDEIVETVNDETVNDETIIDETINDETINVNIINVTIPLLYHYYTIFNITIINPSCYLISQHSPTSINLHSLSSLLNPPQLPNNHISFSYPSVTVSSSP